MSGAEDLPATLDASQQPLCSPLLILSVAYLVITGWNLHLQSIANPDEPRYAAPARIMLRSGKADEWLIPKFNTQPRLLKPVLFYWLIAAAGGAAEKAGFDLATGFRIGPLLMGLLSVIGIFLLGRKLFSARVGFIAAVILMTGKFFHDVSRELVVDMTLTAFLLWSWVFVLYALQRLRKSESLGLFLFGFYVSLGLACATKGPALVALFVVAPLVVFLAWTREFPLLKRAGLWWGVPLSLILGLGWFIVVQQMGYDIIKILKTENMSRAVGGKDHQQYYPFVFYVKNLFETFAPWCMLFPFAAWWSFRQWNEIRAPSVKFLACALTVPFILLGIIISKRALYLLPVYPFIALWLAYYIEQAFLARDGEPSRVLKPALWVLALLIAGGVAALIIKSEALDLQAPEAGLAAILGAAIAAGLINAAGKAGSGARLQALLQVLAVAAALTIGYEAVLRPVRERTLDSSGFYRTVCERLEGRRFVMLGESSNEAVWYLDRPNEAIDDIRYPDLKARFFEAPGTVLLVTEKELEKTPRLKDALALSSSIQRGNDKWWLATPAKGVTPDPEVFAPKRRKLQETSQESEE